MEEKVELSKKVLKSISVDTRAEILKSLEKRPMTSSELSKTLDKHVTTISEHLDILKNSNLVERIERPGHKWVYYKLTKDGNRILHPTSYYRWTIVLSLVLVVMLGTFASAQNANPGDSLYGVKTFTESAMLSLATSPTEKANLNLQFAEARLQEAKAVADKNNTAAVNSLVNQYEAQMNEATAEINKVSNSSSEKQSLLENVNEDAAKHITILQNIQDKHPDLKKEIDPGIDYSMNVYKNSKEKLGK